MLIVLFSSRERYALGGFLLFTSLISFIFISCVDLHRLHLLDLHQVYRATALVYIHPSFVHFNLFSSVRVCILVRELV